MKNYALGRMKQGVMNNTEAKYAKHLDELLLAKEILWYKFEGVKLRLAGNTTYSPDFAVMNKNNEIELHEVKGFWTSTARVKIKVASEQYPFKFIAVYAKTKKDGGGWKFEEI